MDVPKEYIKMCEKAKKMQELWKPQEGDICYSYLEIEIFKCFIGDHNDYVTKQGIFTVVLYDNDLSLDDYRKTVWLPLQNQLQEMVNCFGECVFDRFDDFIKWYKLQHNRIGYRFKNWSYCPYSMEQLWLAFVMKKKYNKIWNGEDWIKEK